MLAIANDISEIIREALARGSAKTAAEWVEKNLGIHVDTFAEHVAVEVVAALLVATIIGLVSFFGSRGIWRTAHRKVRASTIRKIASTSFVIVRCPIANDKENAIGNEISARLETAFRAFAGWGEIGGRPFHVIEFPLSLAGDEGTKAYDKSIEAAKLWLEKTDADILIWGKRVKGESVGMIRLIGKDRKKGVTEVRRVDFDRRAVDFDQALANAVGYEAAELTQITLSEPQLVQLDVLRDISSKLEKLSASDAPALSTKWRDRMAIERSRLVEEIARRTPDTKEGQALEVQARQRLATLDRSKQPLQFAQAALLVAILIRRKNWADPVAAEIDDALRLVDEATAIFKIEKAWSSAAEAALERVRIRRLQLVFRNIQGRSLYRLPRRLS